MEKEKKRKFKIKENFFLEPIVRWHFWVIVISILLIGGIWRQISLGLLFMLNGSGIFSSILFILSILFFKGALAIFWTLVIYLVFKSLKLLIEKLIHRKIKFE